MIAQEFEVPAASRVFVGFPPVRRSKACLSDNKMPLLHQGLGLAKTQRPNAAPRAQYLDRSRRDQCPRSRDGHPFQSLAGVVFDRHTAFRCINRDGSVHFDL